MLNKKTIDAYHKITAPDGLRERIEQSIREEKRPHRDSKRIRKAVMIFTSVTATAVAACLLLIAGRPEQKKTETGPPAVMRLSNFTEPRIMLADGTALGTDKVPLEAEPAGQDAVFGAQPMVRVTFRIESESQVRLNTDSDILSYYEEAGKPAAPGRELVLKTGEEWCVILPQDGSGQKYLIEMSGADGQYRIEIEYDRAQGMYLADCQGSAGGKSDN